MRETDLTPREMIQRIAQAADVFSKAAMVGGMETAGAIVAYLDAHPEDIEPFLNGGVFEFPNDWISMGDLTWHTADGRIVDRRDLANGRTVARLGALGSQLSQGEANDPR